MTREQLLWTSDSGLKHITNNGLGEKASLVLAFGARVVFEDSAHYNALKSKQPNAKILLTSTAGEIQNDEVFDDSLCVTAIAFEKTALKAVSLSISEAKDSYEAGVTLAKMLNGDNLCHVFLLSDGLHVNGSEIVKGLNNTIKKGVQCTDGLA